MGYKRRNYLINKPFQLRFAFYVCSWLIALSFAYPLIISSLFDQFFEYMSLDPTGPSISSLLKSKEDLLTLLFMLQTVTIILTFVISIFMSHKIAGPLYRLRRHLIDAKEGDLDQVLSFRKKDYFQELVGDYNGMMTTIRSIIQRKQDSIQNAIPHIEKALALSSPEAQKELREALGSLRESQKN